MSLSYLLADDHTTMLNIIEKILCHFESCFSRKAAFRWFVIIITGLMLRSDKLGVTSILRDLALAPGCYDSMLHFFRASSWSLEDIRKRWFALVNKNWTLKLYFLTYNL
ncbi:transposase, partial [Lactobacillus taiwanensis]|uniref:transposase n=1 Tax=Lactobacillus taiwanensis TaxID=508451 RepID=UPI00273100EA